jgi:DNA-binding transcriptional ArsR family regulator
VVSVSLFEVLAEPHRRRILDALHDRDRSVGELVDLLGLAQPTVSKHLKTLREARLVVVRPEAQRRWYQLQPEPLRELDRWLEPYRRTWASRLDALAEHLDRMEDHDE